ncbi:MAG: hypothetical protein IIU63_03360, partial [Clostridia bacterium]|nr:hypothetical protein [Clostridia bacterium]
ARSLSLETTSISYPSSFKIFHKNLATPVLFPVPPDPSTIVNLERLVIFSIYLEPPDNLKFSINPSNSSGL